MDNHAITSGDRWMGIASDIRSANDNWLDITRTIRKKAKAVALAALFITSTTHADIHGSRASFLQMNTTGMSLSYLSQSVNDQWRTNMENSLLNNGDTHIYLYTRNDDDDVGHVRQQPDWEQRLDHLNSRGLKPIMWLMADDSPSLAAMPMSSHKAHNLEMVRRLDSKVYGYVIGLEVDEYWTAAQTNELIQDLKKHTNKTVGVHLTPATPLEYVTYADVLYLQTGFGLTQEQFKARVKATLLATSKPVIVSEYSMQSDTVYARTLGDIACQLGAIGTGNGRSIQYCGQQEKKKSWLKKNETTLIGVTLAGIGIYMASKIQLPIYLQASDNGYKVGIEQPISENMSISFDVDNTERITGRFNWRF